LLKSLISAHFSMGYLCVHSVRCLASPQKLEGFLKVLSGALEFYLTNAWEPLFVVLPDHRAVHRAMREVAHDNWRTEFY